MPAVVQVYLYVHVPLNQLGVKLPYSPVSGIADDQQIPLFQIGEGSAGRRLAGGKDGQGENDTEN